MKIILKFERYFLAQNENDFKMKRYRKKTLKALIITKLESISIVFVLKSFL